MALFGNFGDGYTKTGKGFFSRLGNTLGYIPFIGSWLAFPVTMIGAGFEALGWLLRGKVASAATVLATGAVSGAVSMASSTIHIGGGMNPVFWGNLGSGALTGESLSTHSRALAEKIIGGATGALGVKPTVLQSYTAGIGSLGTQEPMNTGRMTHLEAAAKSKGESVDAAYARVSSNQADHLSALQAAQNQPDYRGV